MSFWCLQFLPKNEQKQVDLRYHSSKVKFICSFFGRIHGLTIWFWVLLTFSMKLQLFTWIIILREKEKHSHIETYRKKLQQQQFFTNGDYLDGCSGRWIMFENNPQKMPGLDTNFQGTLGKFKVIWIIYPVWSINGAARDRLVFSKNDQFNGVSRPKLTFCRAGNTTNLVFCAGNPPFWAPGWFPAGF